MLTSTKDKVSSVVHLSDVDTHTHTQSVNLQFVHERLQQSRSLQHIFSCFPDGLVKNKPLSVIQNDAVQFYTGSITVCYISLIIIILDVIR